MGQNYFLPPCINMQLIEIKFFLNSDFISTEKNKYRLIGETTEKTILVSSRISVCKKCVQKRLLSSSFFSIKKYKTTSEENKKNIREVVQKISKYENQLFEYEKQGKKIIFTKRHNLIPIPGCNCK